MTPAPPRREHEPGNGPDAGQVGGHDPVRARRAKVAAWTLLANRIGYLLLAFSIAAFVIAFVFGFSPTMATVVLVPLVASFVLLAPSIVLGYAVKAAERDDRERGF